MLASVQFVAKPEASSAETASPSASVGGGGGAAGWAARAPVHSPLPIRERFRFVERVPESLDDDHELVALRGRSSAGAALAGEAT